MLMTRQAAGACSNAGNVSSVSSVFGMQMSIVLMSEGDADERDRMSRAWRENHGTGSDDGMIVQTAVAYQARYMCARDSMNSMSVKEVKVGW
jgi:hypothetical protein